MTHRITTLDEIICKIYENREIIFNDSIEQALKCDNKRSRLINYEVINHEQKYYMTLEKEKSESLLNSYLIEYNDFAKHLFIRNISRKSKREIKKEIRKHLRNLEDSFVKITTLYLQNNNINLANVMNILRHIDENARIRTGPVIINNSRYIPPENYLEIENELYKFENEVLMNNSMDEIEKAFHIHYHFVRIHPFWDGNGRSARVWSNAYLYVNKIFPVIIPLGERKLYASLLEKAQLSHKKDSQLTTLTDEEKELFEYFAMKINNEYERYISKSIKRQLKMRF